MRIFICSVVYILPSYQFHCRVCDPFFQGIKKAHPNRCALILSSQPCQHSVKAAAQFIKLPPSHGNSSETLIRHIAVCDMVFEMLIGSHVCNQMQRSFYQVDVLHIYFRSVIVMVLYVPELILILIAEPFQLLF